MREILFRGQDFDSGEWLTGHYSEIEYCDGNGQNPYIKRDGYTPFRVKNETVGQYTGINDCKGNRVFEGDIIEEGYNNMVGRWTTKKWIVKWNQIEMAWMCYTNNNPYPTRMNVVCCDEAVIEVVGNIHDNKDLSK